MAIITTMRFCESGRADWSSELLQLFNIPLYRSEIGVENFFYYLMLY